jgi:hypothetical protein
MAGNLGAGNLGKDCIYFCYPRAIFDIVFCGLEYNKKNASLNVFIIVWQTMSAETVPWLKKIRKISYENHKMSSQNDKKTDKNRQKTDKIVGSAK